MAESFIRKHFDLMSARFKSGEGKAMMHDGVIAGATGVAIGFAAAHSKNDLEMVVARKRIPLDFAGSIGGLVFSLGFGSKGTRDVVRQASVAGLGIASYRVTEKHIHLKQGGGHPALAARMAHPAVAAHAGEVDVGNDPVLQAAARL
jgi:hypothetical protein